MRVAKLLGDLFTGPDGETVAIGRVYSLPVLLVGLAAPVTSILLSLRHHQPVPLEGIGIELGALAAAAGGMVAITNHVDNDPRGPGLLGNLTTKGA